MASRPEPTPDRVEHNHNCRNHYDYREAGIDEALKRGFGFLRKRPEDIGDGFEAGHQRRGANKRQR